MFPIRSGLVLTLLGPLTFASGCGSASASVSEDEHIPVGGPRSPEGEHCVRLGYQNGFGADSGYCLFPDGSKCKDWEFFRGQCGQQFSYCHRQGGSISNGQKLIDSEMVSFGVCTMPDGRQCTDNAFAKTNLCNGLP